VHSPLHAIDISRGIPLLIEHMQTMNHQPQQGSRRTLHRREFLQLAGLGALGASILPSDIISAKDAATVPPKIGLQLFTVRNEIQSNIVETLRRVADVGFEAVEVAFWPENVSLKQAGKYLKDAGLTVCSAHIAIPIGDKKAAMLEAAEAYNCKRMIWHGWPEDKRYSSLDGTKELVDVYNEANQFAKSNGLQFGLHNHWWEYRNKVGGRFVYEILFEFVDPDVLFEIDTYWVKVAGQDPAKIVGRLGKRAPLLHIKDGPARWHDSLPQENPDPMVAVGKGAQKFPAIVKAAKGNTEWMIVEMDKTATDVFVAIQDSYNYLIRNDMAKGKKPA
jgi:sugar phosphate isomerase/epimerase